MANAALVGTATLALAPLLAAAFFPGSLAAAAERLPLPPGSSTRQYSPDPRGPNKILLARISRQVSV
jgi:hypothetical protein